MESIQMWLLLNRRERKDMEGIFVSSKAQLEMMTKFKSQYERDFE